MNVLVTGASGFIGQSLVGRLLARRHHVRGLVRGDEGPLAPEVEWVRGDLADPVSLERATDGMEAVVHLAWATGVADERIARAVNVEGTRALLAAARRQRVRRFVFCSTISASRRRMGPYGRTKKEVEALVAQSGMEWVTLRPSLVYGSADVGLFATLAGYLRTLPIVPVIGDGRIALDPIHVDDVCEVIEQCLVRAEVTGKAYDLLGPDRVTFNEFLERLSQELGIKKPLVHIPAPLALLVARSLGVLSPRPAISVDNVLGLTSPADVDPAPARRDFPVAWTPLDAGLKSARLAHRSRAA